MRELRPRTDSGLRGTGSSKSLVFFGGLVSWTCSSSGPGEAAVSSSSSASALASRLSRPPVPRLRLLAGSAGEALCERTSKARETLGWAALGFRFSLFGVDNGLFGVDARLRTDREGVAGVEWSWVGSVPESPVGSSYTVHGDAGARGAYWNREAASAVVRLEPCRRDKSASRPSTLVGGASDRRRRGEPPSSDGRGQAVTTCSRASPHEEPVSVVGAILHGLGLPIGPEPTISCARAISCLLTRYFLRGRLLSMAL